MGQAQNPILTTMDLKRLEYIVMDEWIFIPVMLVMAVNSFGIGFILGLIIL